ncbi:Abi family protein [Vibrio parahaemolyticus]|uniref:Abi family protein n=1 Tax=Vibrio vulnificus TaxID=672 RepID=UPI001CDCD1A2|nr:Abi family protein [Vibrio vulnificus]EGQ8798992.1 hypothetical protein [Vibrio parahaemolyticus]EGU8229545.1 hypothetical protein [Vibrio parahaemolyticus]EIA1620852.1 Abi family protein [Vibrio parahaemolyticus]EIT7146166.1 Abi family protein [Vibrio vulnificus]EIV8641769.1 Abi family protein [Vibrio parahaemolyticus]
MTKQLYKKPFRSPEILTKKMIIEGLPESERSEILSLLRRINYFRVKVYAHPFKRNLISDNKKKSRFYQNNVSVTDITDFYAFDACMRDLCLSYLSDIEIIVRSKLDQAITRFDDNPFWYFDPDNFVSRDITQVADKIKDLFEKSHEEFATHYKNKYQNDVHMSYEALPPSWIAIELMTFGSVCHIMNDLNVSSFDKDGQNALNQMAIECGAMSFAHLAKWMDSFKDARNKCAHQNRIVNRNIRQYSRTNKFITHPQCKTNRIYQMLCVIKHILNKTNHDRDIKSDLERIFSEHKIHTRFLRSMGFPEKWKEDPIWS